MFPRLEEGASTIRKMLICLLAGSGPILMLLRVGEGASTIRKKTYCAPVPLLTFFRVGESASTSRKNYFQRAPN